MILLIDNYDSFTYNLVRYFKRLNQDVVVARNDSPELAERLLRCQAIVISPGPKAPVDAGGCLAVVREHAHRLPILGICLGHQIIYEAFGGTVVRATKPIHGRATPMQLGQSALFHDIPDQPRFARYHSLIACPDSLPHCLEVIAWSEHREIMAIVHREFPVYGVQFHPESVLSTEGYQLLANFLKIAQLDCPSLLPANDFVPNVASNLVVEEEPVELPVVLPAQYSLLK